MKRQAYYNQTALVIFCVSVLAFAGRAAAQTEFLPPIPDGKMWKLAWSDEFDGEQID